MTREEAIDIIKCLAWHTRPDEEDIEQAIKALKQEPSSSKKLNKWIPLDEKEPNDGQLVLVTFVNRYKQRYVKIAEFIEEDYRKHDGKIDQRYCGFHSVGGFYNVYDFADEAVAWMPLPEPYNSEILTGAEGE